jgi:hypothetical protein
MTKERWLVTWIPAVNCEAVAAQRGQLPGDGTSYWDWMEPEEQELWELARSEAHALRKARHLIGQDVFGTPRIECQAWQPDEDGDWRWERISCCEVGRGYVEPVEI